MSAHSSTTCMWCRLQVPCMDGARAQKGKPAGVWGTPRGRQQSPGNQQTNVEVSS